MRRRAGFTILELLVVVAILGILAATAVPLLNTWRQRASGSEAFTTLKMILNGEILYFLDHETFFPTNIPDTILIPHSGAPVLPGAMVLDDVKDALEVAIPQGHFLDFTITRPDKATCQIYNPSSESCVMITVSSSKGFILFKSGTTSITGIIDNTGKIIIGYP
jgi:prepilin-type N-terminal cleavage/methylation domain-containing protein